MLFCFWRTSARFFKKFLLSESCTNFLEVLAELGEISWKFPRPIQTRSLTHTCPACFVNPISIRRHPSARKVQAVDERKLLLHQRPRYDGTFFLQVAAQCAILEEISPLRILREFSRVARRTWRNFLEITSLRSKFLAYSHLPCLLVNPIPPRQHPGAEKLHAVGERKLQRLQ